ncbi:MAG: hypothetical protein QNJ91_15105 [Gammaproteobacteria bacterium]|nr:hypothetical protein [Gammaproteobacteria bacterium]
MASPVLQFIAVTSGGRAFDIAFPLHPQTRSAQSVSDLVTALLDVVSNHAQRRDDVSDGDILQALAMTAAIRGRMLDGEPASIEQLTRQLYGEAWQAVNAASDFAAGRA